MKTNNKLFLASFTAYVTDKLVNFIGKRPDLTRVAFIPTAADSYSDKWFVEKDKVSLLKAGYKFEEMDIKNNNAQDLIDRLSSFDMIFVSGGNVFYLLEKTLESGFDKAIKELLNRGVVYTGSSAGATLVGPTLEPVKTLDDPSLGPNLKSYDGLNIVDFVVLPHFGEVKYKERYEKVIDEYRNSKYKIVPITNNQAVAVINNSYTIVETPNQP